ncbi:unnamed protein product [Schistosoma margrebowiei]|uniref:Uncharacterized protein n=1 Tax=Schistosoma margrebowiei TaxID=48269 RepID=A0A183MYP9_9TREM|nr:unnamed protein product [Schistosoma margrebowiei]
MDLARPHHREQDRSYLNQSDVHKVIRRRENQESFRSSPIGGCQNETEAREALNNWTNNITNVSIQPSHKILTNSTNSR